MTKLVLCSSLVIVHGTADIWTTIRRDSVEACVSHLRRQQVISTVAAQVGNRTPYNLTTWFAVCAGMQELLR